MAETTMGREQVAQVVRVAREVMGWDVIGPEDRDEDAAHVRIGQSIAGLAPPCLMSYGDAPPTLCVPAARSWDPFSSASDDYMVLERVRETWGVERINAFAAALWDRLTVNAGRDQRHAATALHYRRGDYAECALAVLDAENREGAT